MGKLRLRVQTVPAWNPVTHSEHTAYTVIYNDGGKVMCAAGWTLRDAVEAFCEFFHIDRELVCVRRPFFPQSNLNYE